MSIAIEHIIKGCIKGEQKAQMHLYDTYCKAMFTIACRYLNEEDAKDAMQEGFLKAFKNIERYSEEFSFGAWLKRIIINQCIDVLKKKQLLTSSIEETTIQLIDDDDWDFNVGISKEEIINAIETLNEKHKIVVKLYLMEGYDHQEISQILKIPVKTSRTHLRRGKLQLQKQLKIQYNGTRY